MSSRQIVPRFFLGANSRNGFISNFAESYSPLDNWHTYIIKGGPGTGKSTLMKRVAEHFLKEGAKTILCPCSSDPASLDGVIFPQKRIVLLDGTSPHIVEPKFPGAVEEIVNLGECWNPKSLIANREEIIRLTGVLGLYHKKASNYLSAAGALSEDMKNAAQSVSNLQKAREMGRKLAQKYIKKGSGEGFCQNRYLSGITPKGHIFYEQTINALAEERILISDAFGAVAPVILEEIMDYLLSNGYEITVCRCPLMGSKPEHIFVHKLGLYFGTLNRFHSASPTQRVIHARRFMNMKALHDERGRLNCSKRLITEMLDLASDALSDAKLCHDELESFYISAMDREKLSAKTEEIIKSISENFS